MEFNNAIVDEKFLDEVNKKLGHPTKKQQEAFKIVVENMNAATVLEDMYRYFVDKDDSFTDEMKYSFETIVKDRKPADVVKILKDIAHKNTLFVEEQKSLADKVKDAAKDATKEEKEEKEDHIIIPVDIKKVNSETGIEVVPK